MMLSAPRLARQLLVAVLALAMVAECGLTAQAEASNDKGVLVIRHLVDDDQEALILGLVAYDAGKYDLAYGLLRRSAELGDITARTRLGFMAENGLGVKRDRVAAYVHYSLAADNMNPLAEYRLERLERRMSLRERARAFNALEAARQSGLNSAFAPGSNAPSNNDLIQRDVDGGSVVEVEIIGDEVLTSEGGQLKSGKDEKPEEICSELEKEALADSGGDEVIECQVTPTPQSRVAVPKGTKLDRKIFGIKTEGAQQPTEGEIELPPIILAYQPDAGFTEYVRDILKVTGLDRRFADLAVYTSAEADLYGGIAQCDHVGCRVVFSESTMNSFRSKGGVFAQYGVVAHELGHHAFGHTLSHRAGKEVELEADHFSGGALAKLGASEGEAIAIANCCLERRETASHPGQSARRAKMIEGWQAAVAALKDGNIADAIRSDPDAGPTTRGSKLGVLVSYASVCKTPYGVCPIRERIPKGSSCLCTDSSALGLAK